MVEVVEGPRRGLGEAVPYARYGETVSSVLEQVRALEAADLDRARLAELLPPGAARAAVDCALWDLESKQRGRPVWELAGVAEPRPVATLRTISIAEPREMARAARALGAGAPLKIKLAGDGRDDERVAAVREAAPGAFIVCDPNEAWSVAELVRLAPTLRALGVGLVEQPVAAGEDGGLRGADLGGLTLCADEAVHTREDLASRADRYQAINVKIDKAGGLTEAIALTREARARGLTVMLGCMVCTSLAIAPAFVLSGEAQVFDLDGPLLLARDREDAVTLHDGLLHPPPGWGRP